MAIILNWNNLPDTLECVDAIRKSDYPNLAVWVVDNDSTEDPTAALLNAHPEIRVLRNAANLGYGGGNNAGLREAMAHGAVYALILNNDAVVAPSMLRLLVDAMESDHRIGMVTPTVFYYDRSAEVYWDGGRIDWADGDAPHDSRGLPRDRGLVASEWLDGSVLLARVAAVQDIGLLDDRYFLYYEDAEWTVRAARRGWRNIVVSEAQAWHKISRSTGGKTNPAVRFYYLRNRYLFMKAHHPRPNDVIWRIRYLGRIAREYRWIRYERAGREAIIAAAFDILWGRWGPYDVRGRRRWIIGVADTLLAPVRKAVYLAKRGIALARRAKRIARRILGQLVQSNPR